jgi:Leucine-rich repeat (LRR) protein
MNKWLLGIELNLKEIKMSVKKILFFFVLSLALTLLVSSCKKATVNKDDHPVVPANATFAAIIPDANLRKVILTKIPVSDKAKFDYNYMGSKDLNSLKGAELGSELATIKRLRRYNDNESAAITADISNTEGLQYLYNLLYISLSGQKIDKIDVSKNRVLQVLTLEDNKLTSLDISKNQDLEELLLSRNGLTSLDLSKNSNLMALSVDSNALTAIDLSKNSYISSSLKLNNNSGLTEIDLSHLKRLLGQGLQSSYIIGGNTNLVKVYVTQAQYDQLTTTMADVDKAKLIVK